LRRKKKGRRKKNMKKKKKRMQRMKPKRMKWKRRKRRKKMKKMKRRRRKNQRKKKRRRKEKKERRGCFSGVQGTLAQASFFVCLVVAELPSEKLSGQLDPFSKAEAQRTRVGTQPCEAQPEMRQRRTRAGHGP
jgi:hypothetical protein